MRKLLTVLPFLACAAAGQAQDRRIVPAAGQTPRRVALLVGNTAYSGPDALRNPVNDVRALATALRDLDFTVQVATDVDLAGFDRAVDGFAKSLAKGDVALFYYSGHGIQVDGENYLVPIGFQATQEAEIRFRALPATQVHEQMQARAVSLSIVILDACRDNPFHASRTATRGLASMDSGRGSLIAFATAPGSTASDNPAEANGLFTKYLLEALREPGLDVEDVFKRVRQRVAAESQGRQVPWTASSVIGTFIFHDPAEERARLEQELAGLERQVADAARRKADQEQAEKERQAAVLRAKLSVPPTHGSEDAGAAERARLEELRKKRAEEQARLQALSGDTVTLEQAQKEVAALEAKIAQVNKEFDAARDEAVKGLAPAEKTMFETTAQFEARKAQAVAARADLGKRYEAEFEAAVKGDRARVAELRGRTYPMAGAKVEFVNYDADASRLLVRVNGEEYLSTMATDKAKALYEQTALIRVERRYDDARSLVLVDQSMGTRYVGVQPVAVNQKDGLRYVWIPPGTFMMGCSGQDCSLAYDESPAHTVTLTKGFWLGQMAVTRKAYERVTGAKPTHFQAATRPVGNVNWYEAQAYCRAVGMRLPTEAEWEYAARDGTTSALYGSSGFMALYDMSGNVWQWVSDWKSRYSAGRATDPDGPSSGQYKILRGGSQSGNAVRVSYRNGQAPDRREQVYGFRCAGDLP